ncbi:hypothetical protein CPB86DRAFT_819791 [Serendipita vermifera]|nr:hypothetical protein CPB86DRAFT_819791 [Serendipita vermifera]
MAKEDAISTIIGAFEKCGIHPFDPSKITEEDMAPAENTMYRASQPLPARLPPFLELIPEESESIAQTNGRSTTQTFSIYSDNTSQIDQVFSSTRSPLVKVSKNIPRICQVDLPPQPAKDATKAVGIYSNTLDARLHQNIPTKAEILATVETLYTQLDQANEELAGDNARLVAADNENGRLCGKIFAKAPNGSKTTPLHTGAHILTAPNSIDELFQADRKRFMGYVLKELKPICTPIARSLENLERQKEQEREEKEKRELNKAKRALKAAESSLSKVENAIERAEISLKKAQTRLENATTPSAETKAKESCKLWEDKLRPLRVEVGPLAEQYGKAWRKHERLTKERQARLDIIMAAEARYKAAIEAEEHEKALEKAALEAENVRRSKLPKRPKDAVSLWKKRCDKEKTAGPAQDDLEDIPLDDCVSVDDSNTSIMGQNGSNMHHALGVGERRGSNEPLDDNIDPILQFIDYNEQFWGENL